MVWLLSFAALCLLLAGYLYPFTHRFAVPPLPVGEGKEKPFSFSPLPVGEGLGVRADSGPAGTGPSNEEQVLRSIFEAAGNDLRVFGVSGGSGANTPTNTEQIFRSVYNSTQNALNINLLGGTVGGSLNFTGPTPWIDVKAYGAKGDGATNDSTAIQNAINACPTASAPRGCVIFFPPGRYYLGSTGLTMNVASGEPTVTFMGDGNGGFGFNGTSQIISDQSGVVLLTIGGAGADTEGFKISGLSFRDSSASNNQLAGAINIIRGKHFEIDDLSCSDFTVGYCVQLDGNASGFFTQIGTVVNLKAFNTKFPVKATTAGQTSAINVIGGHLNCNNISSSIGMDLENSSTWGVYGPHVDSCATGIKIFGGTADQADANRIDARIETSGAVGTGILVDGGAAGAASGNMIGKADIIAFATGISITANATATEIGDVYFRSNTTDISDSGKGTTARIINGSASNNPLLAVLGGQGIGSGQYIGFRIRNNVPSEGSGQIPTGICPNFRGCLWSHDLSTTAGGLWFNGTADNIGSIGAGLYGGVTSAQKATSTTANQVRFNSGVIEFTADTGLTAGNSLTATVRANVSTAGFSLQQQGAHLNTSTTGNDLVGVLTCSSSTASKTFTTAFTSTPVITVSDETTAGGARVSAKSASSFTVTCTGASDVVDYMVVGNPN